MLLPADYFLTQVLHVIYTVKLVLILCPLGTSAKCNLVIEYILAL